MIRMQMLKPLKHSEERTIGNSDLFETRSRKEEAKAGGIFLMQV